MYQVEVVTHIDYASQLKRDSRYQLGIGPVINCFYITHIVTTNLILAIYIID